MATMKRNNVSGQLESVYEAIAADAQAARPVVVNALKAAGHTFYQAFVPSLVVGITTVHDFSTLQDLVAAAAIGAVGATAAFLRQYIPKVFIPAIKAKFTAKGAK